MMNKKNLLLGLRIIIAILIVPTLFFKLTGAPDTIYIFTKVGLEPMGRIGIGIAELIAVILILIPKTAWLGAISVAGIMGGAIFMHLTKLGIDVNGDGGGLFFTAILLFVLSLISLWFSRKDIPFINK